MKRKSLDEIFKYLNVAFGLLIVGLFFWPALIGVGAVLLMLSFRIGKMRKNAK